MNKRNARPVAAALTLAPCVLMILFCKWLGVELFYSSSTATIWEVGKMFSELAKLASNYGADEATAPMTLACVLVYALLAVTLVMIGMTGKSIYSAYQKGGKISTKGYWGTIVLSALILVTVWIVNAAIQEETDGWIRNILILTATPYLSLAFSVAGILCCKHIPDAEPVRTHPVKAAHTAPQASYPLLSERETPSSAEGTWRCTNCGKDGLTAAYRYCPECGKEQLTKHYCENCGTEMRMDMRFCPKCGMGARLENL